MKKKHGQHCKHKKVIPVAIEISKKEIVCLNCQDTGLFNYIDKLGYHGQTFCHCPVGIKLSRSYEHDKCPLCQNGCFAIVWRDSPTKPGRKEYRQVRCPHFKKP